MTACDLDIASSIFRLSALFPNPSINVPQIAASARAAAQEVWSAPYHVEQRTGSAAKGSNAGTCDLSASVRYRNPRDVT